MYMYDTESRGYKRYRAHMNIGAEFNFLMDMTPNREMTIIKEDLPYLVPAEVVDTRLRIGDRLVPAKEVYDKMSRFFTQAFEQKSSDEDGPTKDYFEEVVKDYLFIKKYLEVADEILFPVDMARLYRNYGDDWEKLKERHDRIHKSVRVMTGFFRDTMEFVEEALEREDLELKPRVPKRDRPRCVCGREMEVKRHPLLAALNIPREEKERVYFWKCENPNCQFPPEAWLD